ncbi:soluble NSF attachment protein [Pelomyxa schiedti]|nr:soluble NSF attachment protein [Pelomyxa schiedti]
MNFKKEKKNCENKQDLEVGIMATATSGGEPREVQRAREMCAQATKKMNSWFGGNGKFEEASELFSKAGNLFKVAKSWDEAGQAYDRAADCQLRINNKYEAATQLVNAAGCYKKTKSPDASRAFVRAIEILVDEGRFSIAARHQQELAEIYEAENDIENAITAYEKAADLFDGDNSSSRSSQCLGKVATFCSQLERYDRAIEIFDKIGRQCLENNLLKWGAKDHFTKAVICHMAKGDTVGARRALEQYQELDVSFSSQRDNKLLTALIEAYENYDSDAFTSAIVEHDTVIKLTPWQTTLLLRVKNHIKAQEGESLT